MYDVIDLIFAIVYISDIGYARRKFSNVGHDRTGTENYRCCKADGDVVATRAPAPAVHLVRRRAERS